MPRRKLGVALYSFANKSRVPEEYHLERWIVANHKPNTIKYLRSHLAEFEKFQGAPLREATEESVTAYKLWCLGRRGQKKRGEPDELPVCPMTVKQKLNRLRNMFHQLRVAGLEIRNPFLGACTSSKGAQPGSKRPTEAFPMDRIKEVLMSPPGTWKRGRKLRCLLALALGGALRIKEVLNVRMADIKYANGNLFVHLRETKKGDTPAQPILPACHEAILAWFEERKSEGARPESPLLTIYEHDLPTDRKVSYEAARKWFIKICRQ